MYDFNASAVLGFEVCFLSFWLKTKTDQDFIAFMLKTVYEHESICRVTGVFAYISIMELLMCMPRRNERTKHYVKGEGTKQAARQLSFLSYIECVISSMYMTKCCNKIF